LTGGIGHGLYSGSLAATLQQSDKVAAAAIRHEGTPSVASQTDVRLDRVTKRFGDVVAVDDLSLDIRRGEFFSLLGPSGCGKTTTLRMIGGFEEATAGTIYLGEADVTNLPSYRRDVNTVFQNYALFPHLNVYENVAFGLKRKRVSADTIRQRVAEMLELVELPGYERRKPSQLSGGQQQRVALARALINHPRVLLLDEPLGALDLKLRKQMQIELKRIQTEVGITFIYVTHDQEEAMTMSDRIAVMRHGRIEQLGTPEDLYERPRTHFVAGFLGVSNLLHGTVVSRDGTLAGIRVGDGTILRAPSEMLNGSDSVRLGVRPEKLRIVAVEHETQAEAREDLNRLRGRVLDASYIGVSTQYLVETGDGHRLTVYAQNLETSGAAEVLADGQQVALTWRPQHTFVIGGADHEPGDPHIPEGDSDE
jgi:spermidine/putrescine transport system ATP-binding protein